MFAGEKRSRIKLSGYPFQRCNLWSNAGHSAIRAQSPWYARDCTFGNPSRQQWSCRVYWPWLRSQ